MNPAPTTNDSHEPAIARFSEVVFRWQLRRKRAGGSELARPVLDRFTLEVSRGEHLGLLGPNGSGKSTALALLAGLHRPESGEVTWIIGGAELPPTSPRARAAFSVVFQSPSLDQHITARDNLLLAGRMRGLSRAESQTLSGSLLDTFDLAARADDRVKTFSGGMKRRLDLARALIAQPSALLLDEPTAGLDEHAFRAFWAALGTRRTVSDGTRLTVVTATHRPDEAALCDRLALVHGGRIIACGSPRSLVADLGEDLIVVTANRPDEVASTITDQLGLVARVTQRHERGRGEVVCEVPRHDVGARLLVRVVELFDKERLDAIALKRPTLADVFAKLTGLNLDTEFEEAA